MANSQDPKDNDKDDTSVNDYQPSRTNAVLDPNDEYTDEEQVTQDEAIKAYSSDPGYEKEREFSSNVDEKQQDANPSDDLTGKPFEDGFEKAGDEPMHEVDSAQERENNHPKYKTDNELDTAA